MTVFFAMSLDGQFIGVVRALSYRQASIGLAHGADLEALSHFRCHRRWSDRYRLYRSIIDAGPIVSPNVLDVPDLYDRKYYPA